MYGVLYDILMVIGVTCNKCYDEQKFIFPLALLHIQLNFIVMLLDLELMCVVRLLSPPIIDSNMTIQSGMLSVQSFSTLFWLLSFYIRLLVPIQVSNIRIHFFF